MTRYLHLLFGLICSVSLLAQTKVDWVSQVKNSPVYDVRAYGAKGDGIANDTAAISATMDAVKAAGGGTVFFAKGTYRYVNPATDFIQNAMFFTNEGSNVIIFGTGDSSVIQFESPIGQGLTIGYQRAAYNVMCNSLVPFNCPSASAIPAWTGGFPVIKQFQNAKAGSMTITCVTASDASVFTAGMDVRLQSGENSVSTGHPPQHYEYNQVASSNAGTGIVTLVAPLDDSYDNQDTGWPPFISIMTLLTKNILIRDLKITHTNTSGILFHPGGVRNLTLERVTFAGIGNNMNMWNGYSEGVTIHDSVFDNMASDLGDSGYNYTLDHNVWKNSSQRTIQASGSVRSYRITNNQISMRGTNCCDNAINVNSVFKTNHPVSRIIITGNTIRLPAAQYGCGIQVISVNDVLISGNAVTAAGIPAGDAGNCGIYMGSSSSARVTNNMVRLTGSQTIGVHVTNSDGPVTNVVIEGNNLGADQYGIQITGTTSQTTLGCNQVFGLATELNDGSTMTVKTCAGGTTALTYYTNGGGSATATSTPSVNHQFCAAFITPVNLRVSHIVVPINTADAVNTTDAGIYTGTPPIRVAHTGAIPMGTTGNPWPSYNFAEGFVTIPAGKNMWCFLSSSTTFKVNLYANNAGLGGIADYGLNSSPGGCYPGADGSCPNNVLRPQLGTVSDFFSIGNYPIIILAP